MFELNRLSYLYSAVKNPDMKYRKRSSTVFKNKDENVH